MAQEVHPLHGFDHVLVHFDSLLLSAYAVVVDACGFE